MLKKYTQRIKQNSFILNYTRMWPFIRPYWGRALVATLITIPIGSLDAIIALSLKPFMDTVIMDKGGSTPFNLPLYTIPAFIVLFTIIQSALDYTSSYLNAWVGGKITNAVKQKVYGKLVKCEPAFVDKNSSGFIVFRCDSDPTLACSGLLTNLKVFTTRLFSSISLLFVLLYTSWQLAIIAIIVLGTALWPLTMIRKKIKEVASQSVVAGGAVLTALNETFSGLKTIASYNLENAQSNRFSDVLRQIFRLQIKLTQKTAWLSPMMHIIISLGIAGTIWFGSYLIHSKMITPGDFVAFMTALLMLYTPIKNIGKNFASVQNSFLAIERIFEFLEMKMNITEKRGAVECPKIQNAIEYKGVNFGYTPDRLVLKDINLTIRKGEKIALVGNSGGGKTTIVNLLPRFYELTSGAILIDGVNIDDMKLSSLRDNIAVVFQDNFLFNGTIRENIMLGRPQATKEEVEQALKSACLDEFIETLPEGLDTEIGERGVLLSGGQKQRVAIARAFLKNAPIVILDEATSALDNKSEAIVQQAIDNLMQDRTVFVIAHRLSTIQSADQIVVINSGEIVEAGTHEELLAKHGAYYALHAAQFKGKEEHHE